VDKDDVVRSSKSKTNMAACRHRVQTTSRGEERETTAATRVTGVEDEDTVEASSDRAHAVLRGEGES
jgi:hypothetical protein